MKVLGYLILYGYVGALAISAALFTDNVWEALGVIGPTMVLVEFRDVVMGGISRR